jgi:Mrp family chromosome partitioning ATPase
MVVSRFADGILLIAKAGKTTKDQAAEARAVCMKAGATVFGTVLNATPVNEGNQSAYYAYYGTTKGQLIEANAGIELVTDIKHGKGSPSIEGGRASRHRHLRSGTHS